MFLLFLYRIRFLFFLALGNGIHYTMGGGNGLTASIKFQGVGRLHLYFTGLRSKRIMEFCVFGLRRGVLDACISLVCGQVVQVAR